MPGTLLRRKYYAKVGKVISRESKQEVLMFSTWTAAISLDLTEHSATALIFVSGTFTGGTLRFSQCVSVCYKAFIGSEMGSDSTAGFHGEMLRMTRRSLTSMVVTGKLSNCLIFLTPNFTSTHRY